MESNWYVFYTRRTLDMRYHMACAWPTNLDRWQRYDEWLSTIPHGAPGAFDSEVVYFPSIVLAGGRICLFYCGNGFGSEGMGYAVLES